MRTTGDIALPRQLPALTSLRWYAALLVFLYHLSNLLDWRPLRLFTFGQTGVAFFFVLSGFVLTWSARPGISARVFYRRRFARVYPAHLVMWLVVGVTALLWSDGPIRTGLLGTVTTLTLTQAWFPSGYPVYAFNGPSWSLSCEAFFYAAFPLLLIRLQRGRALTIAVVTVAVAALASVALSHSGHGSDIAFNNPLIRAAEFVLGIALALRIREGWRPPIRLWHAVTAFAVLGLVARRTPLFPLEDYVLLVPFAGLIVAGAMSDLAGRTRLLRHRLSVYLGELSFCFYLVHQLLTRILLEALGLRQSWSLVGGVGPALLAFVACFAAAMALHHLVEKPAQRALSGSSRRRLGEPSTLATTKLVGVSPAQAPLIGSA